MSIVPPQVVSLVTFTCDRCGKAAHVEQAGDLTDTTVAMPELPEGWESTNHPDRSDRLFFDRRDCMGVWYATFVRVTYGGPEELPPRRRNPRTPKPASAKTVPPTERGRRKPAPVEDVRPMDMPDPLPVEA